MTRAAVFLARLGQWDRVPEGELLADQEPWAIERLFFPHCKMEPPWVEFAFAVDISAVYERKRQALAAYQLIFQQEGDRLLALYEAEDHYYGRMPGWPMPKSFAMRHRCQLITLQFFVPPSMDEDE